MIFKWNISYQVLTQKLEATRAWNAIKQDKILPTYLSLLLIKASAGVNFAADMCNINTIKWLPTRQINCKHNNNNKHKWRFLCQHSLYIKIIVRWHWIWDQILVETELDTVSKRDAELTSLSVIKTGAQK